MNFYDRLQALLEDRISNWSRSRINKPLAVTLTLFLLGFSANALAQLKVRHRSGAHLYSRSRGYSGANRG